MADHGGLASLDQTPHAGMMPQLGSGSDHVFIWQNPAK